VIKILYLYNKDNWALHNIGKLWFSALPEDFVVDLINYHSIEKDFNNFCSTYDYIWFGYLYMYMKFSYFAEKSIVSIHDPIELFPQTPDWKSLQPLKENLEVLHRLKYVTTISQELLGLLERQGVAAFLLPTSTLLPLRDISEVERGAKPMITSIAEDRPRKNLNLLNDVISASDELNIESKLKIGTSILEEREYVRMLDASNIYLCTSYQEGGPIPAMDAMARGCVVLTTPVGQMLELVEEGENGYICNTKNEFLEKIKLLATSKDRLYYMRTQAIKSMQEKRNLNTILERISQFLSTLIHPSS
jgi:hypothetical protein